MGLSKCVQCGHRVDAGQVYKTVDIPTSPQHIALLYKCGRCGRKAKTVAEVETWERLQEEYEEAYESKKRTIKAELLDLDAVEGLEDLIAIWRAQRTPPVRESVLGACECAECKRRLYG